LPVKIHGWDSIRAGRSRKKNRNKVELEPV